MGTLTDFYKYSADNFLNPNDKAVREYFYKTKKLLKRSRIKEKKNMSDVLSGSVIGATVGSQAGGALKDYFRGTKKLLKSPLKYSLLGAGVTAAGALGGMSIGSRIHKLREKLEKKSALIGMPKFKGAVPMIKDPGKALKLIKPQPIPGK